MHIEELLARHCGAVLMKKRPAALFSPPLESLRQGEMDRVLRHHHLRHIVLCGRCARALVLVYDRGWLARHLRRPPVVQALSRLGYPAGGTVSQMLSRLRARVCQEAEFPHEIGFFLGYPAEDVLGFIRHGGRHYKHCGLWKVYGSVPRAKAMFAQYEACRRHALNHVMNGGSLLTLPLPAGRRNAFCPTEFSI